MQFARDEFPIRFGKYVLIGRVAEGGMAEIMLALEEVPHAGHRLVTIKRIRPEYADDPDYIDFFLNEGRVSLQCSHPNLPHILELGRQDGAYFLAMEYIHGRTLLDLLRGAIRSRKRPSVPSIMAVGIAIASALEHAHGLRDVAGEPLGVVHRDVTPQNVMITTEGSVKLIDFGIVRSAIQLHRTATGIVKGKFAYMAPEQLDERPAIDQRADLFALGIVLWESLAARPLMRGKSELDTIDRIRRLPIPELSELRADVPRQLSAVIGKALERAPDCRFQSATEMLTALEQVAHDCGIVSSTVRLRQEAARLCGRPEFPTIPDLSSLPSASAPVVDNHTGPDLTRLDSDAGALLASVRLTKQASSTPAPPESGLQRDPLLLYYLRHAAARLPAIPGTSPHDADQTPNQAASQAASQTASQTAMEQA